MQLMLALLLVRTGGVVGPADFEALLWEEDPPAGATNIIHRHIGALRRLLEPGLPSRASGRWVERHGRGYRLAVDAQASDLVQFRTYVEAAQRATRNGDHAAAATQYLAALRTWGGRCGAGLEPAPAMLPEFVALDHERSAAACAATDIALAGGQVRDLLPVLRSIAEQDLFDEALQARLMLALAADGKQADAMAVFEKVRLALADQLGVDPGAELRAARARVLRQQGVVAAPAEMPSVADRVTAGHPSPRTGAVAPRPPAQVPLSTRFFTGRERELGRLSDLLPHDDDPPVAVVTVAVDGLPGVGKTSLVVHWAHTVAGKFPDGQLFIDLQGYDAKEAVSTEQALTHFLSALVEAHSEIPETAEAQASLYRALTAGRRMLVILDNARDAEQVGPLLLDAPGCFVIVTSRNKLSGLVVQEGAHHLGLDPPSMQESRAGLLPRLGPGRDADDLTAIDDIIEGCGRLPLAMAVVAARAAAYPNWRLSEIAQELRDAKTLDVFEGDDPRSDVRSVFSWSYRMLSEPAARLFRLLALHPGSGFGSATAASLAGIPLREAEELIEELTRTRLLTPYQPRRYLFHDLVHLYAVELSETVEGRAERQAALARLMDHLQQTTYAAGSQLRPRLLAKPPAPREGVTPERITGVVEAMSWFAAERSVLEAVVEENSVADFPTWRIVENSLPFYQRGGMFRALEDTARSALRTARLLEDREGQARMHRLIAGAKVSRGLSTSAINHFERALTLFDELGKPLEQAFVYSNLGFAWYTHGAVDESLRYYKRALEYFVAEGNRPGEADVLLGMGYALTRAGNGREAVESLCQASAIFDELGDHNGAGTCAMVAGRAFEQLRRFGEAIESRHGAQRQLRSARNQWQIAENARALGDLYLRVGRPWEAVRAWEEARRIYLQLGYDEHERSLAMRISRSASAASPR
jgi:DNA-binding SARP family transcriptional activator